MNVTLPNGQTISNVPEGTTKAQLVAKLQAGGQDVSWYKPTGGADGIDSGVIDSGGAGVARPQPVRQVPQWGVEHPTLYGIAGAAKETLAPVVEAAGMVGGALAGAPAGPVGGVAGAGLGYAGARRLVTAADVALGNIPPETIPEATMAAVS